MSSYSYISLLLVNIGVALSFPIPQSFRHYVPSHRMESLELPHKIGSGASFQQLFTSTSILSSPTNIDRPTSLSNEDLEDYARSVGVTLTFSSLGPAYRVVARAKHDESLILGYCEGFIRPGREILHVDKLEVWKKALEMARKESPTDFKNGGQVFGISLLLGSRSLLYAKEAGCKVAEFLAIDDEEFQHKRLVRFFKRAGFKRIRYVGDDLASVPDRLVWGGCGTLMNNEIETLLSFWKKILFETRMR
mmetsp:Transcript_14114/g.20154  ORF Transcript_14114/g.20154 Transcript_14114/m.20154 type:complete len:249 (+) Transcript_14114:92-838(+)